MKYPICILLFFFTLEPGFSQIQEGNSIVLKQSYTTSLKGLLINPAFSISKKSHSFSFGPVAHLDLSSDFENRSAFKLTGIQGSYSRFGGSIGDNLNFSVNADLIIQRRVEERNAEYFDPNSGSFMSFKSKSTDFYVQPFAGYGLNWNFSKNWFAYQSLGIGLNFNSRKTESPFDDFTDTFLDLDWLVGFGIGVRI